mgnify:CR=1 FL=1
MAVITTTFGTHSVSKIIRDLDCDLTVEHNVNGGAAVCQQININNSANASDHFYLHIWNVTSGVTYGSTKPDMVLYCAPGSTENYIFPDGLNFATGLSIGGSRTHGAVASWSPTAPANAVGVSIYID